MFFRSSTSKGSALEYTAPRSRLRRDTRFGSTNVGAFVLMLVLGGAFGAETVNAHGAVYPPPHGPYVTHPGYTGPAGGGGAPGPNGPGTGGPAAPPTTGGPSAPSPGGKSGPSGGPSTGSGSANVDPTSWETWWAINQDRYIALKTHTAAAQVATGSDAQFLGDGHAAIDPGVVTARVIPALTALLEKDHQQDIVTGAMIALARLADGPLAERASELGRAFAAFRDDPNQEIAETSVVAAGIVGDASSAPELVQLLEDGEGVRTRHGGHAIPTRTRAFAGFALGLLGAHTQNEDLRRFIVHHLVNTLRETHEALPDVQVACVTALGLTPLAWSKNSNEDVHAPATPAEARQSTRTASASRETEIDCLLALLADTSGDRWVRAHVPTALARLTQGAASSTREEILHALLLRLSDRSHERDEVVQGCVLALGVLGNADRNPIDVQVRTALKSIIEGGDLQSRRFALIALAQCAARPGPGGGDEGATEVRLFLAARLSDGKSNERGWAAIALGILEHERRAYAGESGTNLRAQVFAALRDAGAGTEVGALAIAAGLMGDKDATPILLAKLEHAAEASTQGNIAVALGLLGDERAAPALRAQLATARFRPELLRETAIGLALIEDSTLVPSLIETLEKAESLASQSAAASVLGWIGDRRTIEPLLTLLSRTDVTESVRAFAAVALGRVCDLDRLPWNAAVKQDFQYRAATPTLRSAEGTGLLDIL